jgi:hypothetical protein
MGTLSLARLACAAALGGALMVITASAPGSQAAQGQANTGADEATPASRPASEAPAPEPTAADMQAAIRRGLAAVAADTRHDTAACGRSSASAGDPAAALICLGGALMGATGLAGQIRITHFEKLGCRPASGAPGQMCDYRLSVGSGPGVLRGPEVAAIVGKGGVARARFLKSEGAWVAFFQDDR